MSLSTDEGKRNKRQLLREIAAEHKRRDAAKLAELRTHIRHVKVRRKQAMRRVILLCRRGRVTAKEQARARARAIRAQARAAIHEDRKALKLSAAKACRARKDLVKTASASATDKRNAHLHAERALQAEMKRIEGWAHARKKGLHKTSAAEARSESDDHVRQNIPGELRELFESVKHQIRGSSRQSRTEEFLRYAEEHPHEIVDAQEALAEREIKRLVAEERALARSLRSRRSGPAALAHVPF
jgi:hypothetical protein